VVPWLWSFLLAVGLTWPTVISPGKAALGSVHADGMKHLWTLWWMRASVWEQGRVPFETTLINYPVGMDLYPIEPLNGVVGVLLPWLDVVVLSNLLVLLNMTLTGVCGAWFGRVLSGSWWGGFIAGTLLEGSAVMAFFVHVGVGELNHLWWLPLGLGVLLMARRTGAWGWFAALTVCLVGAMLSCFYLGFFLALAVAVVALSTLWAGRKTPALLGKYAVAAGLSIAVVLPVTQAFSGSYKSGSVPDVGLRSYVLQDHGQPITDPAAARLEPKQLLTPGRTAGSREEGAYGGGRYVGFLALGLAIVGLARNPRRSAPLVFVGVIGVMLALGSYLTVGGTEVLTGHGGRIRLPIIWLNRTLGYLAEPLNFPVRFLAMSTTALAGIAACAVGAGRLKRWEWALVALAPLAVLEVGWGQMLAWPWASFSPREASALEVLRDEPDDAVIDLALAVRSDHENRWSALSTHTAHGKPMQAVPVERIEYFARDGFHFVNSLQLTKDLSPLYENRGGALSGDYRGDFAILRDAGFGWFVVSYRYGGEYLPSTLVSEMTRVFGEPVARSTGLGAWRIPDVDHTPAELEAWKEAHQHGVSTSTRMTPGMGPPPAQPPGG